MAAVSPKLVRLGGALLALVGLLVGAFVVTVWIVAFREARHQPGSGHFLVPFTLGGAIFLAGSIALIVVGVGKLVRRP